MASEDAAPDDKARKIWETQACLARARMVRNQMATAMSDLERTDVPAEWHDRARATIDAAWRTLAHRSVAIEHRLRLMREVDKAANTKAEEAALGEDVFARLPPELIMLFGSDAEALGRVVEAWRKRTPGRTRRGVPGKWGALAAIWEQATGEATTSSSWKELWKGVRHEKQKTLDDAYARAKAANIARERADGPEKASPMDDADGPVGPPGLPGPETFAD